MKFTQLRGQYQHAQIIHYNIMYACHSMIFVVTSDVQLYIAKFYAFIVYHAKVGNCTHY